MVEINLQQGDCLDLMKQIPDGGGWASLLLTHRLNTFRAE